MICRQNLCAVLCGLIGFLEGTCLAEVEKGTPPAITPRSYFGYQLGGEGDATIKSSLERYGTIGPRGDRRLAREAEGLPVGLDSLTIGYSPKTIRCCCITATKSYGPRVMDKEIFADLEILYGMIKAAFTNEVVKSADFDLHNPPKALYASVENSDISLVIRASRRSDAICNWIEFDVADKRLVEIADNECSALLKEGKDLFRERERNSIRSRLISFGMLAYLVLMGAVPLLVLAVIVQGGICLFRHWHMSVALSWPDILLILLVPLVWGLVQQWGLTKSLSNLIELPIIGAVWGLCFTARMFLIMRHPSLTRRAGSWLTFAVMIAISVLAGLFFPALPE